MEFDYNDELLINDSYRQTIQNNYRDIAFVLKHKALREKFKTINTIANKQKSKSRYCGFVAVCLATVALIIAAFEPIIYAQASNSANWSWVPKLAAGFAAFTGLIAVSIGFFGILFSKSKDQWLHNRLITERLRQWHAQSLVGNITAIITAAKSDKGITDFIERREAEFEEFKQETITQVAAVFQRYISKPLLYSKGQHENLVWARSQWAMTDKDVSYDSDDSILQQLLTVYESIRMRGQIQYTDYKLKSKRESFWTHAGVQARVIGNMAFVCVIGIFFLHMLVLCGAISDITWMKGPFVHALAVSCAIIALAGRTLDEGFQPRLEIERLDAYLTRLLSAEKQFKNAKSIHIKIAAMREIEEAAVAEMISFLKTNNDSKFVM